MNQESSPQPEREATVEGILEAFNEGERTEGWRLFDEWEQVRLRENDAESSSMKRLAVAVESIGFHIAAGDDPETISFEIFTVGDAISSDRSLSQEESASLMTRFKEVTKDIV